MSSMWCSVVSTVLACGLNLVAFGVDAARCEEKVFVVDSIRTEQPGDQDRRSKKQSTSPAVPSERLPDGPAETDAYQQSVLAELKAAGLTAMNRREYEQQKPAGTPVYVTIHNDTWDGEPVGAPRPLTTETAGWVGFASWGFLPPDLVCDEPFSVIQWRASNLRNSRRSRSNGPGSEHFRNRLRAVIDTAAWDKDRPPEARLVRKVSVKADADTLATCIRQLSEKCGVPIAISVEDLEAGGIKETQRITVDIENAPAQSVLMQLLWKADPAGRLVYVLRSTEEKAGAIVTTRERAKQREELWDPVVVIPDTANKPAAPVAVRALGRTIAYGTGRESLQRHMESLAKESGVPIQIDVEELQREGLTKNQAFAFEPRKDLLHEILKQALLKADPNGRLVYVVRHGDESDAILITTRSAAVAAKDEINPVAVEP